jgi:hypothetical protein
MKSSVPLIRLLICTLTFSIAALVGEESVLASDAGHQTRRVVNSASPSQGTVTAALSESWRRGSNEDDLIFGLITCIDEDADGNLYVMDAQLSQIHVFSPSGEHKKTLFGEGDGPGEVRGPRDMVFMPDGRIGVVQEMPGKLIFVTPDGDPAGTLPIAGSGAGGFCQTFAAFAGTDLLLVTGFIQGQGNQPGHFNQTNFLSSVDSEGHPAISLFKVVHDIDFANFTFDETRHLAGYWWNTDIGPDGKIYSAPRLDQYEIQCFSPGGEITHVIEREYEPLRRTAAEKQHFTEVVQAVYHGAPIEITVSCAENEPVILYMQRGLRAAPDGTIQVLTTRGVRDQAPGVMATFDIFEPDGAFVRQLAIEAPFDGQSDGVFLYGDHAYIVTGYADAMMAQFTGGQLGIDLEGDSGAMEVIRCNVTTSR